jgi:hypothetical protein
MFAPTALAVLLLAPAAAAACCQGGLQIELTGWPGLGALHIARPDLPHAPPLVVILPDRLGRDRRADVYVERLNAEGMATLEFDPGDEDEAEPDPGRLAEALAAVVTESRLDARRMAFLGFGRGGRQALALAQGRHAAALYPGCPPSSAITAFPALILSPGLPCAAGAPGLAEHAYPGATHAWDYADGAWPESRQSLPAPEGGMRLPSRSDPQVTENAVGRVAAFLRAALRPVPAELRR